MNRSKSVRVLKNIFFIGTNEKHELFTHLTNKKINKENLYKKEIYISSQNKNVNFYYVPNNNIIPFNYEEIDLVIWCFDWSRIEESTKILTKYFKDIKEHDIFHIVIGFNWDGEEMKIYDQTKFSRLIEKQIDYDFFISFEDYTEEIYYKIKNYIRAINLNLC